MDRWKELINYLDMSAEWVQVILAGFALYLAWNYLGQHDEKVRVEFRLQLIKDTMANVIKFQDNYNKIFRVEPEILNSNKFFLTVVADVVRDYENKISYYPEVDSKYFEIDLNVKLINSSELTQAHQVYKSTFILYKEIFEKLKERKVQGEDLKNLLKKIPLSPYSKDNDLSLKMTESYRNLMDALLFEFNKRPI
ncbi:hypothetical protein [Algoriphagus boritolerans]|uniref:Uncharacterized protein n=1 Tax=Algoriphagus boritolerans DSM 17298 = JCM 18970 TaxID=1120964 RepID=A0A1H5ZMH3_9BACT|nr:hypothetical protein [Algoriphagus boritolerans]SEG37310.1 hypothetical protein SAMN03080598_03588 [Algoriphagus boritolerans DSM 17298 = JCM 18970]